MPFRAQHSRPAMYNTPAIRNGGFGALQLEAVTNRPLSIARRHLAASQLRMQDIEPHELSSSEWLRFLAMEVRERERWMVQFRRRRRNSDESTSSAEMDGETAYDKAEEARQETLDARRVEAGTRAEASSRRLPSPTGTTPSVVAWVFQYDQQQSSAEARDTSYTARRPMHTRRTVGEDDAPPTYLTATRAGTPPPAYDRAALPPEGLASPPYSPDA